MSKPKFELMMTHDILEFRQKMLWPDKPLTHVMVPDDDTAIHIGSKSEGTLIAAGSFFLKNNQAQLRKLAVDPQYRGKGMGSALIQFGANIVRDAGADILWCDARENALSFYEKIGFKVDETVFLKSGIRYRKATISLKI